MAINKKIVREVLNLLSREGIGFMHHGPEGKESGTKVFLDVDDVMVKIYDPDQFYMWLYGLSDPKDIKTYESYFTREAFIGLQCCAQTKTGKRCSNRLHPDTFEEFKDYENVYCRIHKGDKNVQKFPRIDKPDWLK